MASEKIIEKTPSGGSYSIITYLDKDGNEVEKNVSEKCVIREFDDADNLIMETFGE